MYRLINSITQSFFSIVYCPLSCSLTGTHLHVFYYTTTVAYNCQRYAMNF